ncbi:MAG: DUF802 domain-containing protein [Comamonadaceae bacterium]|nr:MAG: DUF802 domain-containing protein [Comamonadaceae bacterium]
MTRFLHFAVFLVGLAAVGWIGTGYLGTHPLALSITALIGVVYVVGAWELFRYQRTTDALARAVDGLAEPPESLSAWLASVPMSVRQSVQLRVQGERAGLPGPTLAPYLVGLLVLLGMLGTFLGMVATLRGTGAALQSATDLQAIRASLAAPVMGLGFAFGTSVAGVAASAMLGLLLTLCRRARMAVAQRVDVAIATPLRGYSLSHQREERVRLLAHQTDLLQRQAEALPRVADRLDAMMAAMTRQAEALNHNLLANQERFHTQTVAAYTRLATTLEQALKTGVADTAQAASAAIEPAVQATMSKLAHESAALHERVAASVQQHLDGTSARLDATGADMAATWQQALTEQRASSEALTLHFRTSLDGFAQTFEQRSGALLDGMITRLDGAATRLSGAWDSALAQNREGHDALAAANQLALTAAVAHFDRHARDLVREVSHAQAALVQQVDARSTALAHELSGSNAALAETIGSSHAELTRSVSTSSVALADKLAHANEAMAGALSASNASLASSLSHSNEALVSALSESNESLAGRVSNAHVELASTVQTATADLTAKVERSTSDLVQQVAGSTTAMVRDVSSLTSDMVERVGTRTTDMVDTVGGTARDMVQGVGTLTTDMVERVGTRATDMVDTVGGTATEMVHGFDTHSTRMVEGFAGTATKMVDGIGVTAADLVQRVGASATDLIQGVGASATDLIDGVGTSAAELMDTVHRSDADLRKAFSTGDQVRATAWVESLDALARTLRDEWAQAGALTTARQQEICDALGQTARAIATDTQAHAQATITEIERLVQAASEAPKVAADVVIEVRQKLSDSMARDNSMLEERSRLLETLGSLLDAVNHASTEQRSAVDALVATSADMLARVGSRFTEQVEAETGKLTGIADRVTSSASDVSGLSEAFSSAVATFSESNDKMLTQLQRIESSLDATATRSDEQLAYYVAQAREVVDLSILSQKQILDNLQRLSGGQAESRAAAEPDSAAGAQAGAT